MVGHGGSRAGSYLTNPTSPIPSHCASVLVTSTLRVNGCEKTSLFQACSLGLGWVIQLFPLDLLNAPLPQLA